MTDIFSTLKGMNPAELEEAVKKAKEFMKTDDGRRLAENLKNGRSVGGMPSMTAEQSKMLSELAKNPQAASRLAQIFGKK